MQVSITASTELQVREAHLLEAVNETLRACVELRSATLNMTPLECGVLRFFTTLLILRKISNSITDQSVCL